MKMHLGFEQLSVAELIQPLQGWIRRKLTQGRPCWANPGLNDSNPFGVAERTVSFRYGNGAHQGLDYRAIETSMGLSNGALRGILGRALGTLRRMPGLERSSV